MGAIVRALLQLALCLAAVACHSLPAAHAATRADLPAKFQVWTLFEVEGQLIYAVNKDDAAKAAALLREVNDDFRARTAREPGVRLLVIADHDVWLPGGDLCRRLELVREGESLLHPGSAEPEDTTDADKPSDLHGAGQHPSTSCEKMRAESAKLGLDPRDLLCMVSHPIPLTRLVLDFGMQAEAPLNWDWAVLLPARHCVEGGMSHVMDAAMKRSFSFGKRLLLAPMLPFVRSAAADAVIDEQKLLLFELHAAAQADWSPGQRDKFKREYEAALASDDEPSMGSPPNPAPIEAERAP